MSMFNTGDILETIEMFTQDNLDVRTVTMGISLLDCIDPDPKKACENIYNKITTKAANLVSTVERISAEYGIPIINKRISVTPIAMLLGACPEADPVDFAKTLDAAGLPKSAYDNFLSQLHTEVPVISANHVTLSDGTFTTASKQKDLLYDYQTLQYYLLFD